MILSAIAAMASNRVIGSDNQLPWHLPEDLQYFKAMTKGKIMIMGRKTFESLPKPLPNRFHIIITRNKGFQVNHAEVSVVHSFQEALVAAMALQKNWPEEVFVVGGAEIYSESLQYIDRIYLTEIEQDYPGDTKFPEFSPNAFVLESKDQRAGFAFCLYKRK